MSRTDREITGDVIAALAASPGVHATDINVTTQDGLVRLMGSAANLEERDEAERIASRTAGITGVENDIVISANRQISDLGMTNALNDALAAQPNLVGIGGKVNAGNAFLMGKVSSLAVANRAIEVASGVDGVRDVVSELQIAAGEPVDNITLANDVAEAISDEPAIDIVEMDTKAEDGLVVITGEVETEREFNLISDRASEVPGVQHVQNLVRVRQGIISTPHRRPSSSGTEYQTPGLGLRSTVTSGD